MRRMAKKIAMATLLGSALASPALAGAEPNYDRIYDGHTQAILADCIGCHTAPGGRAFAGGAPLRTPFGTMVAPNITPDKDTGIGAWSEADFRRAVKQGISPGGKRLYPAMPFSAYAKMSDEDVARLWDYMQTVEPVRRAVRSNLLRWPFNIRALMAGWDWLYYKPAPFTPDPAKSAAYNRGDYIVTGPGHCGACHTAKTMLGADSSQSLGGASLQGWFAPDITGGAARGIGAWSAQDVVAYLKTGHNDHSMASGPMAEAIEDSTSQMTDTDLQAIAVYLKDVPGYPTSLQGALAAGDPRMQAGQAIYEDNCMACHNADGKGQSVIFPPLAGNPIVRQASAETMARVVLAGTQAAQTRQAPTAPAMPAFDWRLNDQEVADVLTYVRSSWGNGAAPVSAGVVGQVRGSLVRESRAR
jgi:mono/diheme cytochrome c family protein